MLASIRATVFHEKRTSIIGRILASLLTPGMAQGSVLPEDRADNLCQLYDGGGVEIDGPPVLIRKKTGNNMSVIGNYSVDMVSSASIDVVTTIFRTEERCYAALFSAKLVPWSFE